MACLPMLLAAPAIASPEMMAKMLRDMYGRPEQIDKAVQTAYGARLGPEQMAVARRNMQAVLFHPKMPAFMWKVAEPLIGARMHESQIRQAMVEVMLATQAKGMARLPAARQVVFVRHMISMMESIPSSQCRSMVAGNVDTATSADVERKYISTLPPPQFESVSALYRDAAEAELNSAPEPRHVNPTQAAAADKVYEQTLTKLLRQAFTRDELQRLGAGSASNDAEMCRFARTNLEAMVRMAEPYRDWKIQSFIQSLQ